MEEKDMIVEVKNMRQLEALEDTITEAAAEAEKLKDAEDGGSCNFDTCVLRIKIPKKLREASRWAWEKHGYGYYRQCYDVPLIPYHGQGNRRSRQAEAAEKVLREAGYDAHVSYELD